MHCLPNTAERNPERTPLFRQPEMSAAMFERLGRFIQSEYGIKMPPVKKTMLQSRLHKRLRRLNMESFESYCDLIFSEDGQAEMIHMIDAVTTNKTDFFRESDHFDYLKNALLPSIYPSSNRKPFLIWSAGCASGEEPYTMAMVLESFRETHPAFDYHILATDLSTRVLETAKNGIYPMSKIDPVPSVFREKYLMKSRDEEQDLARICPELRARVQFERLNFMTPDLKVSDKLDVIFCRNVMIYFEREVQRRLVLKLADQLKPNGTLFLGHSETLTGFQAMPFVTVGPNIYRKID